MTEQEIETLANKVADILTDRYDARVKEQAALLANMLWDAPITERARTIREALYALEK